MKTASLDFVSFRELLGVPHLYSIHSCLSSKERIFLFPSQESCLDFGLDNGSFPHGGEECEAFDLKAETRPLHSPQSWTVWESRAPSIKTGGNNPPKGDKSNEGAEDDTCPHSHQRVNAYN